MILFAFVANNNISPHNKNKLNIDESLFVKIGKGDGNAFEELYLLTEKVLYGYVLSMTANHDDTLDILQETYLKIRGAAHLYKPMGKPLAWMFTIARNLYRGKLALKYNSHRGSMVDMDNSLDFSYVSDPTDRIVLQSALSILSEEERQIIILYALSGLKHREIAESINMPLSTILSKYHRGLKKLRNYLTERGVF